MLIRPEDQNTQMPGLSGMICIDLCCAQCNKWLNHNEAHLLTYLEIVLTQAPDISQGGAISQGEAFTGTERQRFMLSKV